MNGFGLGVGIMAVLSSACGSIILALIVFFVGSFAIKKLVKLITRLSVYDKLDDTLKSFMNSFIKCALYIILIIAVIQILGVPMASVITVLASAGVAVGLALQGALSNLAGGIMIMIFKPFKVSDYIEASGVSGVVQEVTLLYTVILTLDNKRVTVPNGNLMNANITDYSAEKLRRVDLTFSCAKSEVPSKIQAMMLEVMNNHDKVLKDPEPFARLSGGSNEGMEFTARAWCKTEDYWDVYFDLTQQITEAFGKNDVKAPAVRILNN